MSTLPTESPLAAEFAETPDTQSGDGTKDAICLSGLPEQELVMIAVREDPDRQRCGARTRTWWHISKAERIVVKKWPDNVHTRHTRWLEL